MLEPSVRKLIWKSIDFETIFTRKVIGLAEEAD